MHREDAAVSSAEGEGGGEAPARAVQMLRTARGTRAQLSAMVMPRHADAEAQDVVRALLDQAAAP